MTKLYLRHIDFAYDTKDVLKNFDLSINGKQLTCLIGASGSGKTSILRLIAGLEVPKTGEIIIDDKTLTKDNRIIVAPHHRQTGYIFQDLALWPHMSVEENIAFVLKIRHENNWRDKVNNALQQFDLQSLRKKYPHQLSGGQKQLVAIARAVVLKPKILLLDEPLTGLDIIKKKKVLKSIMQLKEAGHMTLLYVTHDIREALAISDEIVVLNNGQVTFKGTPNELKISQNLYVKQFLEF